ncbi:hypothetical protein [Bombiscardovia coagulans]|uniref:hypothetical protein n=1 Tax=Bombiscardovia coagulans TaxID=686666 RepID=UPI001314BDC7|nr:hypothetical protein [Bombiscardovia coagulans]
MTTQLIKSLLDSSTPKALQELREQRSRMENKIRLLEAAIGNVGWLIDVAEGTPPKGTTPDNHQRKSPVVPRGPGALGTS